MVKVPVVATNDMEVAPALALTEAGTVKAELLDDIAILAAVENALENVAVQVVFVPGVRVETTHCRPVTDTGAAKVTFVDREMLLSDAVMIAV